MIVKTCKHHGDLTEEQVTRVSKIKKYSRQYIYLQCRQCYQGYYKKSFAKQKQKPEFKKYRAMAALRWRAKNLERHKKYTKQMNEKCRLNLRESYVVSILKKGGIPDEAMTPDMIDLKRTVIKIRRKIRNPLLEESQNEEPSS